MSFWIATWHLEFLHFEVLDLISNWSGEWRQMERKYILFLKHNKSWIKNKFPTSETVIIRTHWKKQLQLNKNICWKQEISEKEKYHTV